MIKKKLIKLMGIFLIALLILFQSWNIKVLASSSPSITVTSNQNNTYTINAYFENSIPNGHIIDLELYNSSNQKVWQSFTTNGGNKFSDTTPVLEKGEYKVSLGLFTPNWNSTYAWYKDIQTFAVDLLPNTAIVSKNPTPTTNNIVTNSTALSAANSSYNLWKSKYVQNVNTNEARVVRPENNNDTVSEGMGYGMLLSYFANDEATFSKLWNYVQKYLDPKGLMNWQISSSGQVIGQGSATDADEDIAYALLRADSKWPGKGYGQEAKNMISAMMKTEVLSSNLINPGDNWGDTKIINPSYLAPSYYKAFAESTGDTRWLTVANTSLSWLEKASDPTTGLLPDWLNSYFSQPSISWDKYPNGFYYDAVRVPIRLLMEYKWNQNQTAKNILTKENDFISQIGQPKLVSGYTLTGSPLTTYLDSTFLSAYAAMAQVNPTSELSKSTLNSLIQDDPNNYFGASLRALTLYIIAGSN